MLPFCQVHTGFTAATVTEYMPITRPTLRTRVERAKHILSLHFSPTPTLRLVLHKSRTPIAQTSQLISHLHRSEEISHRHAYSHRGSSRSPALHSPCPQNPDSGSSTTNREAVVDICGLAALVGVTMFLSYTLPNAVYLLYKRTIWFRTEFYDDS